MWVGGYGFALYQLLYPYGSAERGSCKATGWSQLTPISSDLTDAHSWSVRMADEAEEQGCEGAGTNTATHGQHDMRVQPGQAHAH